MTYDADLDPKTWRAQKASLENALREKTEALDAEIKRTRKYQQKYYECLTESQIKETALEAQLKLLKEYGPKRITKEDVE